MGASTQSLNVGRRKKPQRFDFTLSLLFQISAGIE